MRIVLDTNVFVGACIGVGSANHVVGACLRGDAVPLMGTTLLQEYEDVLLRPGVFRRSRLNEQEREALLDIFLARCEWVRIYYGWRPNLPDEGDNHLIELAVAGSAQWLITRNVRDFSGMQLRFPHMQISTPERFLEELKS